MKKAILCLDVGGTEIKAAVAERNGDIVSPICHFPAEAEKTEEQILNHFVQIFEKMKLEEYELSEVHFAFPGPFDYKNGICLLKGLNKYDSLYGKNLRQELSIRLHLPESTIRFCNDADAFALGEMMFGRAAGTGRAIFLCIGTGCGSAFGVNGRLADENTPGVPSHGQIYATPFQEGCIDDYISKRGLQKLTQTYLKTALEGRELAERAAAGDSDAVRCFCTFGQHLCNAVTPFLCSFHPDCLCLGGQITKSADLFLKPLKEICHSMRIQIYVTEDTSKRTIQGLAYQF